MKKIAGAIFVLSLIGVGISLYLYLIHINAADSGICQVDAVFDCKTVDNSPYAITFGIPNSVLGMIGYGLMALGALWKMLEKKRDPGIDLYLFLVTLGGLGFSLYLTGIEAFVIHAWCIFCLASQAVMLAIFTLTAILFVKGKSSSNINPSSYDGKSDSESKRPF